MSAAGEQLRVAHALTGLPAVRGAFADGRISYSKARALTRVATPANEEALVGTATACTASQLDRLCQGIAHARSNAEVIEQAARAFFTSRWEPDGTLRFSGRLSTEDGAVLLAALAAARPEPVSDGATGASRTADAAAISTERPDAAAHAARSDADALILLAEHALAVPPDAVSTSPVRLVVHATAGALSDRVTRTGCVDPDAAPPSPAGEPDPAPCPSAEGSTRAILDAGPGIRPLPLGSDSLRRLTCEALVEAADHPDSERAAAVQHRFASARQRRALLARDGGCTFPGCPGGPTDPTGGLPHCPTSVSACSPSLTLLIRDVAMTP